MPQRLLTPLLGLAAGLPIVVCVLIGVGRLLSALSDASGAHVVDRIALALGIVWIVSLVGLVLVQGWQLVNQDEPRDDIE